MKKYNGISLIETLISLTIVGISIVALLPVMTVKKEGNDPTKGNSYWSIERTFQVYDTATSGNVDVTSGLNSSDLFSKCSAEGQQCKVMQASGVPKVYIGSSEFSSGATPTFRVYNKGFANSSILPLNVTNRLYYNGQTVEADTNRLLISADTKVMGTKLYGLRNILINADNVILNNINKYDSNYDIIEDHRDESKTLSVGDAGESRKKVCSIALNNNANLSDEYVFIDADRNIIAIGQNAVKFNTQTRDLIVIANIGTTNTFIDPAASPGEISYLPGVEFSGGLAIGAREYNNTDNINVSHANNFVIHHSAVNNYYNINANLSVPSYTASALIIGSDRRLKNIISEYKSGINETLKINPVVYSLKSDEKNTSHIGVIAQDLKKIFPNSVIKNNNGFLMISTDYIFYAILNSIKELNNRNIKIAQENDKLEQKIAELKKIRDNLKASKGGRNE